MKTEAWIEAQLLEARKRLGWMLKAGKVKVPNSIPMDDVAQETLLYLLADLRRPTCRGIPYQHLQRRAWRAVEHVIWKHGYKTRHRGGKWVSTRSFIDDRNNEVDDTAFNQNHEATVADISMGVVEDLSELKPKPRSLDEQILLWTRENPGKVVNYKKLSLLLEVSHSGVWRAMRRLKRKSLIRVNFTTKNGDPRPEFTMEAL